MPELVCADFDRSLAFYRDVLGFDHAYGRANPSPRDCRRLTVPSPIMPSGVSPLDVGEEGEGLEHAHDGRE
ncbi:MAG: hypothetical protein EXQ94_02815 [Alphaproteobacteria bacterium]|nr:hypothetical protein [Alphaproteobacteria bacterium]